MDKMDQAMQAADDSTSGSTEVGAYESPCDSDIKPIYPVRYAYANFFESTLQYAFPPQDIQTLLSTTTVSDAMGYVVRLMRPGWIYIKDEDFGTFSIFKYEQQEKTINGKNQCVERYRKFIFKNGNDASDGVIPESGARGEGYYFAFVSKKVSNISIVYSEHEWHANVINAINGDKKLRQKSMQSINLDEDKSLYALEATEANFTRLIEDYRHKQQRVLTLSNKGHSNDLGDMGIDILTTQESYWMDADGIGKEIRSKLCYGEKARIVVLFDPVGRQKEIVQAHRILIQWQQQFLAENHYPLTIGGFVEQLKNSDNEDIQKAVKNGINQDNWNHYWLEIKQEQETYLERQRMFSKLYEQFMMSPLVTNCVGGLDSYFKYFFTLTPSPKTQQDEFNKLIDIASEIFISVTDSEPGKTALEKVISDAADSQRSFSEEHNVWGVLWNTLVPVLTQPQEQISWAEKSLKAVDRLFQGLAPILGSAMYGDTWLARTTSSLSKAAIQQIKKRVPMLLHIMGIEILPDEEIFTREQLNQLVERIKQNHANFAKGAAAESDIYSKIAHDRMPVANKLFDWEHALPDANDAIRLRLPRVGAIAPQGNKFSFENAIGYTDTAPRALLLLFDTGFSGLSAFGNYTTLSALAEQTLDYEKADPLTRGNVAYTQIKAAAAIISLTVDVFTISKNVTQLSSRVIQKIPTAVARQLAPKLGAMSQALEEGAIKIAVTGALAAVNFLSAAVAAMDTYDAYQQGNTGEAVSEGVLTLAFTIFGGIAVAALMGITAPVWLTISAFTLLIGGTLGVMFTSRSALENILYNCFWGAGKQYGFWNQERDTITSQMQQLQNISISSNIAPLLELEPREFINLFSMPNLEIIGNSKWFKIGYDEKITYKFILPNYEAGVSDVIYCFYTNTPSPGTYQYNRHPDEKLITIFDKIRKSKETSIETKDGVTTISIPMKAGSVYYSQLEWYYSPSPELIVPMRILNSKGEISSEYIIGMIDEKVK